MNHRLVALDFICGCLSIDTSRSQNDSLCQAMTVGQLDWAAILQIANDQLISPTLWVALRTRGLTAELPSAVREYLSDLHRLNRARNEGLRSQAVEAVRAINAIGVVPILLKGAASLFSDTYADPGSRVMLDLDILVPESAARECWNALHKLGYRPLHDDDGRLASEGPAIDYDHHHHLQPLYRAGAYGVVEVHRAALPQSRAHLLPDEDIFRNVVPVEASGADLRIPSPTDRVLHALIHSLLVDRRHARGTVPLRLLHELATMQSRFSNRVDWDFVRHRFQSAGQTSAFAGALYVARAILGLPLPKGTSLSVGPRLHYARLRSQAAWLWVDALAERALWFSVERICERYQCRRTPLTVNLMRIRLFGSIVTRKSAYALSWALERIGAGRPMRLRQ